MERSNSITYIDLFAGVGGFSLGFERAGFVNLGAIELCHYAATQYLANFPKSVLLGKDIKTITARTLENQGIDTVDVVIGGSPCQGFSIAGKQNPEDARNDLLLEFARVAIACSPKIAVLENVPNLLDAKFENQLDQLFDTFDKAGYNNTFCLVDAADYGIPQYRKRAFFFFYKEGECNKPYLPVNIFQRQITVRDALQDIPRLENYPALYEGDRALIKYEGQLSEYAKRLTTYENQKLGEITAAKLHCISPERRHKLSQMKQGDKLDFHYRLHADYPSRTVRAMSARAGHFVHPWYDRFLTVRELARLQSFPDWFKFSPQLEYGGFQVGNAVPPLLAEVIANTVREAIQ